MSTTFWRIVDAAKRYGREQAERDKRVKPHPYVRSRYSGAGNCETCHRPEDFWAHHRSEW